MFVGQFTASTASGMRTALKPFARRKPAPWATGDSSAPPTIADDDVVKAAASREHAQQTSSAAATAVSSMATK